MQSEGLVRIAALSDVSPRNVEEDKLRGFIPDFQLGETRTFTEFDELFSSVEVDALYFAIPPGFHSGEVVEAAGAGVHIFAEKPMSLFMDEAVEMDEAIRRAGVVSTVGFHRRYDVLCETAHRYLADKRVVAMTSVSEGALESHSVKHSETAGLGGPADKVWAKNRLWSGSSVVEAGIHQTDLMRYWCGDVSWVQAAYVPRDAADIEDAGDNPYAYSVAYGFRSGAVGNLLMSRLRRVYRSDGYQNILWDHGHLKFEGSQVVAYYYDGPYPPRERPGRDEIRHALPTPERRDPTEAISRAFIRAVGEGDEEPLRSTFSSSMNSLAAVLAANVSHERNGERIDLGTFLSSPEYAAFRVKPAEPTR